MKVQLEPLLTAVAIGAVIWIIGSLAGGIVGYYSLKNMMDSPIFDPERMEELEQLDPSTTDPMSVIFGENYQGVMALTSVANLLQCLSWIFSGIAAGAAYVVFYRRRDPMAVGGEAGAGAVAGALAVVAGYLISTIFSTLFIMPLMGDFMGQVVSAGGPEMAQFMDEMGGFVVLMVAVGAICSIIFYGVLGAITGALGAFIGNSLAKPAA